MPGWVYHPREGFVPHVDTVSPVARAWLGLPPLRRPRAIHRHCQSAQRPELPKARAAAWRTGTLGVGAVPPHEPRWGCVCYQHLALHIPHVSQEDPVQGPFHAFHICFSHKP